MMAENANYGGKKAEEVIYLTLKNMKTNTTFVGVPVFQDNTMDQILVTYGAEIGVNLSGKKYLFENERTRKQTADEHAAVSTLDLETGDTLLINDDGGVA